MKKIEVIALKSNVVLLIENNNALLIDCGYDKDDTQKIIDYIILNKYNLKVIISTHYHKDHIGGLNFLIENFKFVKVYTSLETKCVYMNHFFESFFYLNSKVNKRNSIKIDIIKTELRFESFKIKRIDLFGHCIGNIGLIIDNILYCPDLIINSDLKLPFVSDLETYYTNLEQVSRLRKISHVVLSHSKKKIISYDSFIEMIKFTKSSLDKYNKRILKSINSVTYEEFINLNIRTNIITGCFTNEFNIEQYEYTEYVLRNFLIYYMRTEKIKKVYKNGNYYLERSKND